MSKQHIHQFNIIGISVRTTNENMQAMKDIPALWNKFMVGQVAEKIPNKIDDTVYCIYTDYEKDHTKPYTTILGCKVKNLDHIPEGMTGKSVPAGDYTPFIAKGNIMQGSVYNEWMKIWDANLPRTFTSDFEVYGAKAQHPENAEVDIFIAVQPTL
jgi:predicted transcriptional regulator YdeE